ncbi:hypothetical protein Agub_g7439 [Astrephomene gubernaculifera]|uniref:Armadillo repeat-containing protein 8 n=1 Tax=Astrephomene gubernaculifera TaxID=47775 RepID=A0AAD3DSQ9_9CHLO|nr:hypothetical protein Agub_g7439 [Astrephomene gubernaculifera]
MTGGGSGSQEVAAVRMVARPRELLKELREGPDTVKALKAIKNQVIGSKAKKAAFISEGAVQQVVEVLKDCSKRGGSAVRPELVQQQAAVVIGSLAYGTPAALRELAAHGVVPYLVEMLHSSDEAVVEAGLRAIKLIMHQSTPPSIFATPEPVCSSSACPPTTTAPTAAIPTSAAPCEAVRLDAAAMAAVVRCLRSSAASTGGSGGDIASGAGGTGLGPSDGGSGEAAAAMEGAKQAEAADAPAAAVMHGTAPQGLCGSQRRRQMAAMAAAVVACCCRREEERCVAIAAGAPGGLLQLLLESERPDAQVSALEGLSLMLPHHPPACEAALACPGVYGRLLTLLRDSEPAVRLLAAGCIATLSRVPGCTQSEAMQRAALPVLLRLLAQPATRPHVPAVLATLIETSEPLQKAAADADTVKLLAGLLASDPATTGAAPTAATAAAAASPSLPPSTAVAPVCPSCPSSSSTGAAAAATAACGHRPSPASFSAAAAVGASCVREGCLRALGSLCLNRDDSRKQLLEAKVLRHVVRCLADPSEGVRAAAAQLVRALSRCVRSLRGGLLEAAGGSGAAAGGGGGSGELAPLLVGLLEDRSVEVRSAAAAALCNLVLDFSSAKASVLAAGGLPRLVALTAPHRPDIPPRLRLHALWALANLTFRADAGVRAAVMQSLPFSRLRQLLSESPSAAAATAAANEEEESGLSEQAMVLLRNLCMGSSGVGPGAGGGSAPSRGGHFHASSSSTCTGLAAVLEWSGYRSSPRGTQALQQQQAVQQEVAEGEWEGEGLLAVLREQVEAAVREAGLQGAAAEGGSSAPSPAPIALPPRLVQLAAHALFCTANLLTGGAATKHAVAACDGLLRAVVALLRPQVPEQLALPAVWCAINFTWPAVGGSNSSSAGGAAAAETEAVQARCRTLQVLGAADLLAELHRCHPSRDVQERARTALEQLRKGAGGAEAADAVN